MAEVTEEQYLDPSELGTKDYWDNAYEQELAQHLDDSEDEGTVWFAESSAEQRVIKFMDNLPLSGTFASNRDNNALRILDLGTGNGHQLFTLKDEGWQGKLVGIDYSEASIDLARRIQQSRRSKGAESEEDSCSTNNIDFCRWDILKEDAPELLREGFDIVLDKGTFDAISLSDERFENNQRGCEMYAGKVAPLLSDGGFLVVTSCNWTATELKNWFNIPELTAFAIITYPQFTFGGKTGQAVSGVCFQRNPTPNAT